MTDISSVNKNKEKSLLEIIYTVYQGKWIVLSTVVLFLVIAFVYNHFSTPVYESKALLKKEVEDKRQTDEFSELVKLQTSDQLETEMELVKTNEVLSGVINELKLNVELKKVVDPNGNSWELNDVFIDFPDSGNNYSREISFPLPIFKNFHLLDDYRELELFIKKISEKHFELWNAKENKLITKFKDFTISELDTLNHDTLDSLDSTRLSQKEIQGVTAKSDFAEFEFSWNDAPVGSKIYFNIKNQLKFIVNFSQGINVSRVGHTDVFELDVRSSSPLACNIIANSIIRHFREVRMEQQKQMVRYSFHFVDEQLTEVQKKLMDAEHNLSDFKGNEQIINIDENTKELLNYQSTLEAEKLQTDLLISNYKNKSEAMKEELQSSGYFDPSLLEPSVENQGRSPFSELMTQLSDLEMKKLELLQKRTENHPDVININEQIRLAKEKLASYNQNTLTSYKILIDALEKKQAKINNLMSGFDAQMQRLPKQESQLATLVREKEVYEKIFNLLLNKREEMRVAELSKLQDIIIVDYPNSPIKPVQPRKLFNMIIGLFLGGFIGIVTVFLLELKKTRFIELDYLEREFKFPVLTLIPKFSKAIVKKIKKPASIGDRFAVLIDDNLGIRESCRLLETKLQQLNIRDKIILITSCEEGSGKSSIVANLAVTMAQNNKKVLIIDCDLRKANLSKMFDVFTNSPGLIDYLNNGGTPAIYSKVLKQLNIIPAGGVTENSGLLLSSERMGSFFNTLDTSIYDYIIIDTPPVTRVVDTLALGQFVKNSILVVRPEISVKETVIGGIQDMNYARIKIRGIIANAVEIQKSYHYKYRYGYGYGYTSVNKNGGGKEKAKIVSKSRSKIQKLFNVGSN
jgi:capsular exopolysaccharide synthesis family protein